jgi:hypothetical membrane protein
MKKKKIFQTTGVYEALSGIGGIILALMSLDFNNNTKLAFAIFSLALFSSVLFAGIGLYKQKEMGFKLSITVQLMQVVNFNIFGLKYVFNSGSKLVLSFLFPEIDIDYALIMEEVIVAINPKSAEFLSINLIPILVFVLLLTNNKE